MHDSSSRSLSHCVARTQDMSYIAISLITNFHCKAFLSHSQFLLCVISSCSAQSNKGLTWRTLLFFYLYFHIHLYLYMNLMVKGLRVSIMNANIFHYHSSISFTFLALSYQFYEWNKKIKWFLWKISMKNEIVTLFNMRHSQSKKMD